MNDLNRSSTECLFHIQMLYSTSKNYVANGKEFGLVERNPISFLHDCEKSSC